MPEYISRDFILPNGVFYSNADNPEKSIDELLERIASAPAADVEVVRHGEWVLTPREENTNYRWSVTAECSECHFSKGEIYVGFFPNFPTDVAQSVVLDYAKAVKLDNYCPDCGARMDGKVDGE